MYILCDQTPQTFRWQVEKSTKLVSSRKKRRGRPKISDIRWQKKRTEFGWRYLISWFKVSKSRPEWKPFLCAIWWWWWWWWRWLRRWWTADWVLFSYFRSQNSNSKSFSSECDAQFSPSTVDSNSLRQRKEPQVTFSFNKLHGAAYLFPVTVA